MRWAKISAMMYRDSLIIRRVKYRLVEIVYFPITTVLIWGLFAIYSREMAAEAGLIVLIINMFWAFAHLSQVTTNILMMEDIWSGSLKQLLLTGVTEYEYMVARMMSSAIVTIMMVGVLTTFAIPFGLHFFSIGMMMLIGITILASMALAVIVASMVFTLGREYGFLVWSSIQLFIILSAPFFPKEIFPKAILYLSYVMPFTAVFQAARSFITTGAIQTGLLWWGFSVAAAYFIAGWFIYRVAFRRAKKTGMLSRLF